LEQRQAQPQVEPLVARANRGLSFRLLAGLVSWLDGLLRKWGQDAVPEGMAESSPEFGWEAPEDWLRRATPQPPADWLERVWAVLPDWEPSEPELAVPEPTELPTGARNLPHRPGNPLVEQRADVPDWLSHGREYPSEPEQPRSGSAVPLPPPEEVRHSEARSLKSASLPWWSSHQLVPQRIVLSPAAAPEAATVTPKKKEPAVDSLPRVQAQPAYQPAVPTSRPDKRKFGPTSQGEITGEQVTYAVQRWPAVESLAYRPLMASVRDRVQSHPVRQKAISSLVEDVIDSGHTPLSGQETVSFEEDRWPNLPVSGYEPAQPDDDPAHRTRLDREQEGKDAWIT
jgi:hypothetical protein